MGKRLSPAERALCGHLPWSTLVYRPSERWHWSVPGAQESLHTCQSSKFSLENPHKKAEMENFLHARFTSKVCRLFENAKSSLFQMLNSKKIWLRSLCFYYNSWNKKTIEALNQLYACACLWSQAVAMGNEMPHWSKFMCAPNCRFAADICWFSY